MTDDVAVSVIMAVHNGSAYLAKALESLRGQTFERFEAIVIDDASTDESRDILTSVAATDRRFRLIRNERNLGLAASLNRGIEAARTSLLARLDTDDIALPNRLAEQVRCFDADPDLILLGSNVSYIDAEERPLFDSDLPGDDWTIRCWSLLQNPFAHPSVMMRRAPLVNANLRYDTDFQTTQDWELWIRLFAHGRVGNLAAPLVLQRVHPDSVSSLRRSTQMDNSLRVQERYVREFLGEDVWQRENFDLINRAFLGDRKTADLLQHDRIQASLAALRILKLVRKKYPSHPHGAFIHRTVRRVVQMGLAPPFKPGWLNLLRVLLSDYPVEAFKGGVSLAAKRLR